MSDLQRKKSKKHSSSSSADTSTADESHASHLFHTVMNAASALTTFKSNEQQSPSAHHSRDSISTNEDILSELDSNRTNGSGAQISSPSAKPAVQTMGQGQLSLDSLGILPEDNTPASVSPATKAQSTTAIAMENHPAKPRSRTISGEFTRKPSGKSTHNTFNSIIKSSSTSDVHSVASGLATVHSALGNPSAGKGNNGRRRMPSVSSTSTGSSENGDVSHSTVQADNSDDEEDHNNGKLHLPHVTPLPQNGSQDSNHDDEEGAASNHVSGFAYASSKRNKEFHALFRSVTSDDYLLEDFSCALSKDFLFQGRLYVSERYICFYSNLFGWLRNLVISFDDVISMEKKSTALVIPNGIVIQTLHAKHTFVSFVSRDSTLEFLKSVWHQAAPHPLRPSNYRQSTSKVSLQDDESDDYDDENSFGSSEEDDDDTQSDGGTSVDSFGASESDSGEEFGQSTKNHKSLPKPGAKQQPKRASSSSKPKDSQSKSSESEGSWELPNLGPDTHAPTKLNYDIKANEETELMSESFAAPMGVVANMLFGDDTKWLTNFMIENQKSKEITEMPPFNPPVKEPSPPMVREYSYIKPLNSVVVKQTKCNCTDTIETWDMDGCIVMVTKTQSPDVPFGSNFTVHTRYGLCWDSGNKTKLTLSYKIVYEKKPFGLVRGQVEKGTLEGQQNFCKDLVAALNSGLKKKGGSSAPKRAKSKTSGNAKSKKPKRKDNESSGSDTKTQSSSSGSMLSAVVGMVPMPVQIAIGAILLVIVFILAKTLFFGNADSEKLQLAKMQEEYEIWKWIDDRAGNPHNVGRQEESLVVSKFSRQQLLDIISITEERVQNLKEKLGEAQ